MNKSHIRTDVLIIGGGIAGCFAAIRASEICGDVTVFEKSTIRRGGSVGPGMDHIQPGIQSPIPGAPTLQQELDRAQGRGARVGLADPNIYLDQSLTGYDRIMDLERWGVKVQEDDGSYTVLKFPERPGFSQVSYRGADTKVRIAEEVRRRKNVRVLDRVMGVDLLTRDGRVVGAVGYNTRTGEAVVVEAKSTILSTGPAGRQYIETPEKLFMTYHSPADSGDGQAMAYRAGAELVNNEFMRLDYTTCRDGGGVFGLHPFERMPVLRNRKGERVLKDMAESGRRGVRMVKEIVEGNGPLHFDCSEMPEEQFRILDRQIDHEYPITRKWYKTLGIDIRNGKVPVQMVAVEIQSRVFNDEDGRTSLEGLYSAGQMALGMSSLYGAANGGHRVGGIAATDSLTAPEPVSDEGQVEEILSKIEGLGGEGRSPIDLEEAVRGVNTDYVGYFKTEGMMREGLEALGKLRREHLPLVKGGNPHEVMRCLEVRNIFDVVELHIRASMMRTESRIPGTGLMNHVRLDYPDTDEGWEKWIVARREGGEMRLYTRELVPLKDELKRKVERMIEGGP